MSAARGEEIVIKSNEQSRREGIEADLGGQFSHLTDKKAFLQLQKATNDLTSSSHLRKED